MAKQKLLIITMNLNDEHLMLNIRSIEPTQIQMCDPKKALLCFRKPDANKMEKNKIFNYASQSIKRMTVLTKQEHISVKDFLIKQTFEKLIKKQRNKSVSESLKIQSQVFGKI